MHESDVAEAACIGKEPDGDRRTLGRVGKVVAKLCLLGCSLAVCLIAMEAFLRIMGVAPLEPAYGDAVLGFTAGRNRTMTFDFPEYGGKLTMHTNNAGFYEDFDTPVHKDPGMYRLIFVGDSQTAGECANDESYPHVAGRILQRTAKVPTECLNAGAGRYSPYQYLVKTRTELVQFKPDHLVVGIYMGNDIMDLVRRDDRPYLFKGPDGQMKHHDPDFILLDDPNQEPSELFSLRVYGLFWRVIGSSMRYQLTRARILKHDAASSGHGIRDVMGYMWDVKRLSDVSNGFMTQALLQYVWFRHFPESLPLALEMNAYVLREFKTICDRDHIRLTYVLIPSKALIEPSDFAEVVQQVERYNGKYSIKDLQAFENQITDVVAKQCQKLGVPVVDLRQPILTQRLSSRLYNPLEMHLTVAGNRLVGRIVAGTLEEQIGAASEAR